MLIDTIKQEVISYHSIWPRVDLVQLEALVTQQLDLAQCNFLSTTIKLKLIH